MQKQGYSKVPVFENGLAQPVFPFTDGKTGEDYDPHTSEIVRYCVYVESDYDMDGDGKRDLIKVRQRAIIRRLLCLKPVHTVQVYRKTVTII